MKIEVVIENTQNDYWILTTGESGITKHFAYESAEAIVEQVARLLSVPVRYTASLSDDTPEGVSREGVPKKTRERLRERLCAVLDEELR